MPVLHTDDKSTLVSFVYSLLEFFVYSIQVPLFSERWNFGTLEFPMLPRNKRAMTVLSTAEAQTSGQKNGILEFRVNQPLVLG